MAHVCANERHVPNSFPAHTYLEKQCGDKLEQGVSMQCIVFFSLIKLDIHFKKIHTWKFFLLNGIGSRWKSYQTIKLIFQFKHGKVKYQLVFLWLLTILADNSHLVETFLFPASYFTVDLGNNNKSVEA